MRKVSVKENIFTGITFSLLFIISGMALIYHSFPLLISAGTIFSIGYAALDGIYTRNLLERRKEKC